MPRIHWHELERRKKTGASTRVKVQNFVQFFHKMSGYTAIVLAFMVLCQSGRSQSPSDYRDVAFGREPGTQVEYSSFQFRSKKAEEQIPCPVNHGADAADALGPCHWQSNQFQHLPQWVWVHFGGPRRIDKVVLHSASAATSPVEFSGQYLDHGAAFHSFFHVQDAHFDPRTLTYTVHFAPVITDNFRLVIERTAAKVTPQSWLAELAQMEVFGADAAEGAMAALASTTAAEGANAPHAGLAPTAFVPKVEELSGSVAISTPWYRLVLDTRQPRILSLALDSLGKGELGVNLLQESGAYPVLDRSFESATPLGRGALTPAGNVFRYAPVELAPGVLEQVAIQAGARGFDLSLAVTAKHKVLVRGGLFRFQFAANQTPTTFVCHPSKLMNYVEVPTYLTAPDFGTAYITRTGDAAAFYRRPSSLFPATSYEVDITPHLPTSEDGLNEIGPQQWHTTLHFAVQAVEPLPALLNRDPRLARFPRYSLDMTQWRPDTGIVSNSVMSINCGLAMLFYAEQAVWAPRLKDGISPMALVGASVDQYFKGARGYMMPNLNVYSPEWKSSRETPAYLVISAWYVIRTIGGLRQAHKWLKPMEAVTDHIESHFDSDGLVDEPGREWFDVYDFQGPDAFSNAADFRAFLCMADVEALAGRQDLAKRYREDAERIKAVYFKTFFNPATGVLAAWKSPDGKLHDSMFPWVNGFAIYQGLLPAEQAKSILQTMLAKMQSIGFQSFQFGLPTNLIPMSPADYVPSTSGAPKRADGKDTWQVYMNGGATPPYEYYFIQALYQTGLVDDAERLLWPLMQSYEKGTFNAGIELPGQKQRNPVGSAFYVWDGSRGRGEGYLPEDWQGVDALFTGHFGISFDEHGYFFEPWSPLKGQKIRLEMPYMGKTVPRVIGFRSGEN
jgi:Bacterial alpha-L-rhamnosidase 6 hairpin glycosidase domain